MATNNTLNQALNTQPQKVSAKNASIKVLLESPTIQAKFQNVLKEKSSGFVSSVLNVVNTNGYLADAQPMSIMTSAMVAATLDLPIDPNLGYAYIVPFNGKNKETGRWEKKAQLIIGYKGYIQLAQRSGQYHKLNVAPIPEGAFISWDPLAEELKYDFTKQISDKIVGYAGYFELLNGFTKTVYWTRDQVEAHRVANNKAKDKRALTGVWRDNYDAMATKTVLRSMLSHWGILSIEMQNAVSKDEKAQTLDDNDQLVEDRLDITDDATNSDSDNAAADANKSSDSSSKAKTVQSSKSNSSLTEQQQKDIYDAINGDKK
ncbi:recombinase RecT [Levilactobacillus brevis]|uniref:Recombinase RecT n=1 Tax=Levilactobacillus brevis TaxID=1580 RepID=A0AA41ERB9_LEVBR|nr:recombinase RecT [Levilactobacillus brevis]MBS0948312.1 recombinase RecT [Levilactobacillus brevis]MBS1011457.1 recombinase RecT [Levilactobacillus brevis]